MAYIKPSLQIGGPGKWQGREGYILGYQYDTVQSRYQPVKFTFSRNSGGTYIDETGLIRYEERHDWPRFTWRNGRQFYLNESERTNFINSSQNIDPATTTWLSFSGTNYNLNAGISPDGTNSATKILVNTTSQQYALYQNYTGTGQYVLSCYVKAVELDTFNLKLSGAISANFNLSTLAISNALNCTASIEAVSNGWYRCSIIGNTGTGSVYGWLSISSGNVSGSSTDGILVWGAQLEAGTYASSYIPTFGAPATRALDNFEAFNTQNYLSDTQGAYLINYIPDPETNRYLAITVGGLSNTILIGIESGGALTSRIWNPFPTLALKVASGNYTPLTEYRQLFSFNSTSSAQGLNGTVTTGAGFGGYSPGTLQRIQLGNGGTDSAIKGLIGEIKVWNQSMETAQIEQETTIS